MFGFSRKRSAEVLDDESSSAYHYDNSMPKSGKWTVEEETFAKKLIIDFEAGNLTDCADGCTLRAYLSRKLNCAPMRISKKYAGQCIGKHAYIKRLSDDVSDLRNAHSDHMVRESDSPSASTSSAASSDSSTISEADHAAEARRAEVSYGTLAEFQVYSSYPQGGMQYARQPVTLVSTNPGHAVHPTPLYPVAHFASGAGVNPAQPWAAYEDYYRVNPCAVVQRPCELEGEGDDHVGLDIDNPYQAQSQSQANGYPGGLRSVSTDYSCVTACSSTSSEDYPLHYRDRGVDTATGRRTPDASPNLVSKVMPHCPNTTVNTNSNSGARGPGQVVTPRMPAHSAVLEGHFASTQAGAGGCGSAGKSRAERLERVRNEAEEWRAVLTYFTSSPRSSTAGTPGSGSAGAASTGTSECVQVSAEEEAGRLVRRDSSFLLHRNASYSSLFV